MHTIFKRWGSIIIVFILTVLVSQANAQTQVSGAADTPWPMYQHDPQHTGRSPFQGPIQKPELLWIDQLAPCSGESGGIAIESDGSLLTSIGGCLTNYDPFTRTRNWKYQYGYNSRSVPVVSDDQTLYWGFGNAFANITTGGNTNWIAELDANMVFGSSPTFGTDGNLYFVHDGLWSFTPGGSNRWFLPVDWFSHAAPAIGIDGNIYAGTNIGYDDICAYTPSGGIYWCKDISSNAYDRTVSVGSDGTIYVPTDGNPEPPYTDSGVLVAMDPSGSVKWHFQPDETDIRGIPDGIAIGPDGSIYFGLNIYAPDSFLYSITSSGQFRWKVRFPGNELTGLGARFYLPITIDKTGNAFLCLENSRCYGISSDGAILWEFEFPLVDSIIIASSVQPIIAQDGLFYLVDNYQRLYAYADPSQYPILKTSTEKIDLTVDLGAPGFTTTIPITSTTTPITFTASISPSVSWLSLNQPVDITPAQLAIQVDPSAIPAGAYQSSIQVEPSDPLGSILTIPINLRVSNLRVGTTQYYLPVTLNQGQSNNIIFTSNWFTDYQLASIDRNNNKREVISHHLPVQIDYVSYSPDGHKVALVPFINGYHQIMIMDTETGETILEIDEASRVFYPAWSPDSNRITYISYKDDLYNGDVYVINLDGTGLTRLTNNSWDEREMFWSPNGEKIAVQVFSWIYLMNSDGTDFHRMETGHWRDLIQGWSSNGKYLLLGSVLSNDLDPLLLGTYEIATGEYLLLADNLVSDASWSPNGSMIAYVGYEADSEYDWDIFTINPDGSNKTNLTHGLDNEDSQPSWSPNSQWLVFSSRNDEIYDDPNYDLFVVKIDGTNLSQLTKNIQADYYPFWIP
jgi:Tol biopolymer transport system component